jgi:hypothetical protein
MKVSTSLGFHAANESLLAEVRQNPLREVPAQSVNAMLRSLGGAVDQVCRTQSSHAVFGGGGFFFSSARKSASACIASAFVRHANLL